MHRWRDKALTCYLKHYTPTSNRVPVDDPAFAEAAARQMTYEYAEQGVVMAEFRLPAFGDIGGFKKFSDESKGDGQLSELSEFSEKFLQAISRGLDHGSKIAKDNGCEPTKFGLILDGNRFTPSAMFAPGQGTS